ncbi:MAG: HAD family hydrolase, partial [Myxococcota bacterium]
MRTLVFDLDGTLLGSDHRIRPRVRAALDGFRSKGGQVVIASSRPPRSMKVIAEELGLSCPVVALNGAAGVHRGELIRTTALPRRAAEAFLAAAEGFRPFVYAGWTWGVFEHGPEAEREARAVDFQPELLTGLDGLPPLLKLTANGSAEAVEALLEKARACVEGAALTRPKPTSLELMAPGISKAYLLDSILPDLGTSWGETMAVGDGENDIEMVQRAALGVA